MEKIMVRTQGMRNLCIKLDYIIDKADQEDIWMVYESEEGIDQYESLSQLLWQISFDPKKKQLCYEVRHGPFYKIL